MTIALHRGRPPADPWPLQPVVVSLVWVCPRTTTIRKNTLVLHVFPPLIERARRVPALLVLMLCALVLAGCGTTKAVHPSDASAGETADAKAPATREPATNHNEDLAEDPLEGFNRAMFTFNQYWDDYFMRPVAKGYQTVTPKPVRVGVSNFFANLFEPVTVFNDLLQGKGGQAGSDFLRFLVNTTIGILGFFDVATDMGLEKHREDFGQTFAKWGVGEGAYLVLPFLGPSSVRDTVGLYGDFQLYPVTYVENDGQRNSLWALGYVNLRSNALDATDILDQAVGAEDRYVFVREAWRQRRRNDIYDGNAPAPPAPDILFEDDPAPKIAPPAKSKQ